MARRQQPYLRQAGLRPDVDPDFASYPYRIPVVRELANIRFQPNVSFFVGENCSGKSTVLEAIALSQCCSGSAGLSPVRQRVVLSPAFIE